jgi:hypothetical protein
MRANAWEGIGKELKIKRKFYAFTCTCDVLTVCPRPDEQAAPPTATRLSTYWTDPNGCFIYHVISSYGFTENLPLVHHTYIAGLPGAGSSTDEKNVRAPKQGRTGMGTSKEIEKRASHARWPLAATSVNTTNHHLITSDSTQKDKNICNIGPPPPPWWH